MKRNLGTFDSMLRLLVAIILIVLYFTNIVHGTLGVILLILAVLFTITSFAGISPLYAILGLSTRKKEDV